MKLSTITQGKSIYNAKFISLYKNQEKKYLQQEASV
jgi:hypothetical protein